MKGKDLGIIAGLALIGWAVYQYFKSRGTTVAATNFGAPLTQRPGAQLRYAAPLLNDTTRPEVSRANQVVGAVQSGAAIAVNLSDVFGRIGRGFRNIFGGGSEGTGPHSTEADYQEALRQDAIRDAQEQQVIREATPDPFVFGSQDPFDFGGFDPNRPFDDDVFGIAV